jgi:hypothetical protein
MAIQEVLARYCHAMDASRADLAIGLFADDAALETPVGEARGRAAILTWIEERLALRSSEYQVGHYLLNPLVTASAPGRARARSMLLYTRQEIGRDGSAELLSTGIYEDELRLGDTGWQFLTRRWTLSAPLDEIYFKR